MAKVEWHPEARQDVERLTDFLWEKDEKAAIRALNVIVEGVMLLESSPYLGRPLGDELERRTLSLPFGASAYIVYYRLLDENTALILRVWNSREKR